MRTLILILTLLPALASAGVINRCYNPTTKQTDFTDGPCPSGSNVRGSIQYQDRSEQDLENDRKWERMKTQSLINEQRNAQAARDSESPSVSGVGASQCAQLSAKREKWCSRNDSAGRAQCQNTLYYYNKTCR